MNNPVSPIRWTWGVYDRGAAYPEGSIRIEESPGARLVANLPAGRESEAAAIVEAHNGANFPRLRTAVLAYAEALKAFGLMGEVWVDHSEDLDDLWADVLAACEPQP